MICVLDTETTGLDPEKHEVIQLCMIPVTKSFEPDMNNIFNVHIQPTNWTDIEYEALKVNGHTLDTLREGVTPEEAKDALRQWWSARGGNQIQPLGHNWAFDYSFLIKFLGRDEFNTYFHRYARDTQRLAQAMNDARITDFEKVSLSSLVNALGLKSGTSHNAVADALDTLDVYRELLLMLRRS